jgi:serine/threonine protein kinase
MESVREDVSIQQYNNGLLFDTRCNIPPNDILKIDYELDGEKPVSPTGEWTGFILLKLQQRYITTKQIGDVLRWGNYIIELCDDRIVFFDNYNRRVFKFKYDFKTHINDENWFVLTFIIDSTNSKNSAQVRCCIDDKLTRRGRYTDIGSKLEDVMEDSRSVETLPAKSSSPEQPGYVKLGDSEFDGTIARFVLYKRIVSDKEIHCIVQELLHPRIVEIRVRKGKYINSVKFVFNDGTIKSYGGKGGRYGESLSLDDNEYITSFGILPKDERLASLLHVGTNKRLDPWIMEGRDNVCRDTRKWTEIKSDDSGDVIGLNVDFDKEYRLKGFTYHVNRENRCSTGIAEHYIDQLNKIKSEAIDAADMKGLPESELPTIYDWHQYAKLQWWTFLQKVRSENPRFLGKYSIKPNPLHISATSVVLKAIEKFKNDEQKWVERSFALKFVTEKDQVIQEINGRIMMNSSEYIIPIIGVIADSNNLRDLQYEGTYVHFTEEVEDLEEKFEKLRSIISLNKKIPESFACKFCIVQNFGGRTLRDAITHEGFVNNDWTMIRQIMTDICFALHAVHATKRIHGDVKPLNIIRVHGKWKLIDLDVSIKFGDTFSTKLPTLAYSPPEMANAVLEYSSYQNNESQLQFSCDDPNDRIQYRAAISYDIWSVGCVFHELVFGESLFSGKNMSHFDLVDLRDGKINKHQPNWVKFRNGDKNEAIASSLLDILLHPLPTERLRTLQSGREMLSILEHDFFSLPSNPDLKALKRSMEEIHRDMDKHFDIIEKKLNENFNMISVVFKEVAKIVPYLVVFVPDETTTFFSSYKCCNTILCTPNRWLNKTFKLYFVDPVSLTVVNTNDGEGFSIRFPRKWFTKALPWIKVTLTVLKVAAAAGRLTGIPIPNIAGSIDEMIGNMSTLKENFITEIARKTKDPELAKQICKDIDRRCSEVISEHASPVTGDCFDKETNKIVKVAMEELVKLLPDNWKSKCGLVIATSGDDGGSSDWILEQYVDEYEIMGRRLLGSKTNDNNSKEGQN